MIRSFSGSLLRRRVLTFPSCSARFNSGGSGSDAARPRQERTQQMTTPREGAVARTWRDEPAPASSLPSNVVPSGLPTLRPGTLLPPPALHHTTLPNGLLVSSQETYGQVGTLALFIEAGSMYEAPDEVGACHFFETTAFKNTQGLSPDEIMALTLTKGLTTSAVFNREVLLFKVDLLRANIDDATRLIAEAVMRPKLSDADLEDGKDFDKSLCALSSAH